MQILLLLAVALFRALTFLVGLGAARWPDFEILHRLASPSTKAYLSDRR